MARFAAIFLFFFPLCAFGQGAQPVFPGLGGQTLKDSLVAHYKPVVVLDYTQARDTLYAKVMAIDDDSLRCIYSGYTLYLDPTQDPTQYIYLNGSSLGMNTEHAYPQGKGAANGNARSDMHHLFPTRIPVNEARGDSPFAEIPDVQTQQWFRNAQVLSSIPIQNIDAYSESKTGSFEPREAVKGDLARAIFYFYTMYKDQADQADPVFFGIQRPTLCNWNEMDPADSAELVKTWRIAPYQENKPNPFILDCTLAFRTYCPNTPPSCTTGVGFEPKANPLQARLLPQPFQGHGWLELQIPESGELQLSVFSIAGQILFQDKNMLNAGGQLRLPVDWPMQQTGIGFVEITFRGASGLVRTQLPLIWVD
ncbi:MAG: endonuclease [Lewinellaceae bacterium]|nr:endonuclease [Lewinellaceae bacterium]